MTRTPGFSQNWCAGTSGPSNNVRTTIMKYLLSRVNASFQPFLTKTPGFNQKRSVHEITPLRGVGHAMLHQLMRPCTGHLSKPLGGYCLDREMVTGNLLSLTTRPLCIDYQKLPPCADACFPYKTALLGFLAKVRKKNHEVNKARS